MHERLSDSTSEWRGRLVVPAEDEVVQEVEGVVDVAVAPVEVVEVVEAERNRFPSLCKWDERCCLYSTIFLTMLFYYLACASMRLPVMDARHSNWHA